MIRSTGFPPCAPRSVTPNFDSPPSRDELDKAQSEVDAALQATQGAGRPAQGDRWSCRRERLVAIYKAGDSDPSDLVLTTKSYGDLTESSTLHRADPEPQRVDRHRVRRPATSRKRSSSA